MPPIIELKKCQGCKLCDEHCPVDVIHFDEERKIPLVKYPEECWHCGSCRLDCPTGAISIKFPPQMLLL